MRISHKNRFVFLSNSQSGSSSIRKLLDPFSDIKSTTHQPYHHHTTAGLLKNHFDEMNWDWDKYYKFTTVRNPWDRMIGRYHFGLKYTDSVWHAAAARAQSFRDFLNDPFIGEKSRGTALEHFAFAKDGSCLVDDILKLEDVAQSLPTVLRKIGVEVDRVPHTNRTSHQHYSAYYDEESREQVREWFRFDIEYGNYQFEYPESQGLKKLLTKYLPI